MKRIILILLTLTLCCNISAVAKEESQIDSNTDMMYALGIYDWDDIEAENQYVSRAFCAKTLYRLLNYPKVDNAYGSSKMYSDVQTWDYAAGEISYLSRLGIVNGVGDNIFNPTGQVELYQLCKMLFYSAGYQYIIDKNADLKSVFLKLAREQKLIKSGMDITEPVTPEILSYVISAFLEADYYEPSQIVNGQIISESDEIFREKVMNLYKVKGVMTDNGIVSLTGDAVSQNKVIVGDILLNKGEYKTEEFLGHYIECYYYDGDDGQHIDYIEDVKSKTEVVRVKSNNIDSISNGIVEYTNENGKQARMRIDSSTIRIYNNELVDARNDEKYFHPLNGDVTFVINDGGTTCSVAIIRDFSLYCVTGVDTEKEIVYAKDNKSLKIKEYSDAIIRDSLGYQLSVEEVQRGDVLEALENVNKSYLEMYITNQSSTGTISRVKNEDKYVSIDISDRCYTMAKGNTFLDSGLNYEALSGNNVLIKFSITGNVAYAALTNGYKSNQWRYGYLIHAFVDEAEDGAQIKLLDQDGRIQSLALTEKVTVDGTRISDANQIINRFSSVLADGSSFIKGQVIRYKTEGNKIKYLDTFEELSSLETDADIGVMDNDCLLKRWDNSRKVQYLRQAFYAQSDSIAAVIMASDAIIFQVPGLNPLPASNDDYTVETSLRGDTSYRIEAYNTNPADIKQNIIVVYKDNAVFDARYRPVIVSDVYEGLNHNEEAVVCISGYTNMGSAVNYSEAEREILKDVKIGDVLQVITNRFGEVVDIKFVYRDGRNEINDELYQECVDTSGNVVSNYKYGSTNTYKSDYLVTLGYVRDRVDRNLLYEYPDGSSKGFYVCDSAVVYVFDRENNRVTMGSIDDITMSDKYDSATEKVIVYSVVTTVNELFIIK